ncbi:LOW QUALITY PROTEIN: transmembrane protein 141 [Geothlypis trichas]
MAAAEGAVAGAGPARAGPCPGPGPGSLAMVNLGVTRVEDDVAAKHPALQQYVCQSHAFMKGIGNFLAGSGAAFAVQKLARQKLPYSLQWSLLLAAAAGSLGYVVTRAETQKCSNFWILSETGKSPQEFAVTGGVSQPAENLQAEDRDGAATLVRRNRYGDVVSSQQCIACRACVPLHLFLSAQLGHCPCCL